MRDAGNLLTRAGFTLPGVDVDEYTVRYNSGESLVSMCSDSTLQIQSRRKIFLIVQIIRSSFN